MTLQSHYWLYILRTLEFKNSCTPLFIASPFTIARTWKQSRCPLAVEWIKKLWYIYTLEYCSSLQRNTLESVLLRWMNQKSIIQRGVNKKKKKERKERQMQSINACIWNLEWWWWWSYMKGIKRDIDVKNRLLNSVGGEDGMIWGNSIETCILQYVK